MAGFELHCEAGPFVRSPGNDAGRNLVDAQKSELGIAKEVLLRAWLNRRPVAAQIIDRINPRVVNVEVTVAYRTASQCDEEHWHNAARSDSVVSFSCL